MGVRCGHPFRSIREYNILYILFVFSLVLLYYIAYLIKFHWHGFIDRFHKESEAYESELFNEPDYQNQQDNEALDELERPVNRIKTGILEKATKEELLIMISNRVSRYNDLDHTAYRYALNNYIIQHPRALAGLEIEENELEELWKNLPVNF